MILASFRSLFLRPCLGDKVLADLHRSLFVLTTAGWTRVPLLQSHRAEHQDVRFLERYERNGDHIWFDPILAIQVMVDVARHSRKPLLFLRLGKINEKLSLHRSILLQILLSKWRLQLLLLWLISLLIGGTARKSRTHHLPPIEPVAPEIFLA